MWNFQTFDNDFFSKKYITYFKVRNWISIRTLYDKRELKGVKEIDFTFFYKEKPFKTIKVYIDNWMSNSFTMSKVFLYVKNNIDISSDWNLSYDHIIIPNSIHLSHNDSIHFYHNEKDNIIVKVEDLNCYSIKWDLICSLKGTYYTFVSDAETKTFFYVKQNKEETEIKDGFVFDFKKKEFSSCFFLSDDDKYWNSYLSNKNINNLKYEKFISENHNIKSIFVEESDNSSKWKFVWNINYFKKIFEDIEREIKKIKPSINNCEIQIKNFSHDEDFEQDKSYSNDKIYSHKTKFYVDILLDKKDDFNNKDKDFVKMLMNLMKTSMGYVDFLTQGTDWEKFKDKIIYKVVIRSYYLHNWEVPLSSFTSLVDSINYGFKIKNFLNDYYIFEEKSQWVGGDIFYNQKIYKYEEEINKFVFIDEIKPILEIEKDENYKIEWHYLIFLNTKNQLIIFLNKDKFYTFDVPEKVLSIWRFVQREIRREDDLIFFEYEDKNNFIRYNIYEVHWNLDVQKIILNQNNKNLKQNNEERNNLDLSVMCDYHKFCVLDDLILSKKDSVSFNTTNVNLNFHLSRISRCCKQGLNISALTFRDVLSLTYFLEALKKVEKNNFHYRLKLNIKWIKLFEYSPWRHESEYRFIWNENLYQINVEKEGHRLLGMLIPNEAILLKQKRIQNFIWCSLDNLKLSIYLPKVDKN